MDQGWVGLGRVGVVQMLQEKRTHALYFPLVDRLPGRVGLSLFIYLSIFFSNLKKHFDRFCRNTTRSKEIQDILQVKIQEIILP